MQSEHLISIVIDANGETLINVLDKATGAILETHNASELLGKAAAAAGEQSRKGASGVGDLGDSAQEAGKKFDDSEKVVDKWGKRAGDLGAAVGGALTMLYKMGGYITGALGIGLGIGIVKTINFGDEIYRLSQRTGASTEALSEYAHVANKTGIEFDLLTNSWQRQSTRISEAARGYGEARGALAELGLNAKALKDLKPEEQFELIADRMALVADESDRARIASKLWETEGVALLQMIDGGSEKLGRMRQEARDLGKTMSTETAQSMVEARENTARLQASIDGLTTRLAIEFAPTLANVTGFISDVVIPEWLEWLDTIGLLNRATGELSLKQAEVLQLDLMEEIEPLKKKADAIARIIDGGGTPGLGQANQLVSLRERIAELQPELDAVNARIKLLTEGSEAGAAGLKGLAGGADEAGTATGNLVDTSGSLAQILASESNAVQQFVASLTQQAATVGLSEEATLRLTAAQIKAQLQNEKLIPVIDELVERYIAGTRAAEDQEKMEKRLAQARDTQLSTLEQLKQKYDPVNAALEHWNSIEAEMLLLLNDENTDQEQLALTLEYVARARTEATHAAELQLDPAKALIEQLELENQAMRLAIANNEDLELATLRLNGTKDEAIARIIKLREEQAALNLEYKKSDVQINTLADAVERSTQRMDDATFDFVRGAIGGWDEMKAAGENAIDAVKNLFLDALATMIHAAITQPIVVQITTALSGVTAGAVGTAGGAAAGGGLLATLANGGNALLSLATRGIGKYIAGAGGWLDALFGAAPGAGFFGKLTTPFASPLAFKAGLAGNLGALGAAGPAALIGAILGGFLGYDPATTGLGAGAGAAIGTLILPGVGTAIGGILGGIAGAFFGSKERPPLLEVSTLSKANASNSDYDQFFASDLGGLNLRSRRIESEDIAKLGADLAAFDNALALLAVDDDHLQAMVDSLKNFEVLLEGEAITVDGILNGRFAAVLSTFSDDVQDYVRGATDLQEQVARLEVSSVTKKLMDEYAELFGDRTFADVIAAAESIQGAGETINDALLRLVGDMQVAALALDALQQLGSADPFELYEQQRAAASQTAYQAIDPLTSSLRAAMAEFDGTAASLVRTAEAAGNLKAAQVELAGQYMALVDQIAGFGAATEDRLNRLLLGDEGYKALIQGQLDTERDRLLTLTDPTAISESLLTLERLIGDLVGLTSNEDLLGGQGAVFMELLAQIRADAEARRQAGVAELEENAATTGSEIEEFVLTLGDPLELAAGRHIEAADGLSQSATEITAAAAYWEEVGANVGREIAAGISEGARAAAGIAASTASEVRGSLSGIAGAVAAAVRDGLGDMTLQMPATPGATNA